MQTIATQDSKERNVGIGHSCDELVAKLDVLQNSGTLPPQVITGTTDEYSIGINLLNSYAPLPDNGNCIGIKSTVNGIQPLGNNVAGEFISSNSTDNIGGVFITNSSAYMNTGIIVETANGSYNTGINLGASGGAGSYNEQYVTEPNEGVK